MTEEWAAHGRPRPVMAGREMVDAPETGCSLCGLPGPGHGERLGFGHLGDERKTFVKPSEDLKRRRREALMVGGHPVGGAVDGRAVTNLLRVPCRGCGAEVVVIPEYVDKARCGSCMTRDIEEKGTSAI